MSRRSEQLLLFAALNAENVEYAVVGGMAVVAHGYVRTTHDLDVFIRPSVENATAAFRALASVDAPLSGMDPTDLLIDYAHYKLQTENIRVDFLTSIGDMPFYQVWNNRVDEEIDGVVVHFISKQDLIQNKLQVGRLIDLADAEQLSLLPDQPRLRLADEPSDPDR
jgi:predicted nucleotidyltransferase